MEPRSRRILDLLHRESIEAILISQSIRRLTVFQSGRSSVMDRSQDYDRCSPSDSHDSSWKAGQITDPFLRGTSFGVGSIRKLTM